MVEILNEAPRCPLELEGEVARALAALMVELALSHKEVTVVLVDDAKIRDLNSAHRQVDAPTDVLSYPTSEPDDLADGFVMPDIPHLGDIIISLETAQRQAAERGHTLVQEVKTLAAHALTHLSGYDHGTEEAWEKFRSNQALILTL